MSPLQSSKGRNKGKTLKGYRTGTLGQGLGTGGGGGGGDTEDTKATGFRPLQILGDSSCVAHWKMNGNGNDETGNHTATAVNSVTWIDGIVPGTQAAGNFTKSGGSYITIPSVDNSYPVSVSMWVRSTTGFQPEPGLMDECFNMGMSNGRLSLGFQNNPGWNQGMTMMYGGSGHYCSRTPYMIPSSVDVKSHLSEELLGKKFRAGKYAWFHLAWSLQDHNNSGHALWVNGFEMWAKDQGGGHGGSAGWKIGANDGGGENWQGDICNVRFFNKQITPADVWTCAQEFYPSGSKDTIVKDALKLWYDFSDTDCYSGSGQVKNLAPDNNKTASGADFWAADVNGPTFGGTGQAKYFDFDGSNDRLEVGSAAGQDAADGMKSVGYSLEAWIYIGSVSGIGGIISSQWDSSPNRGVSICTDDRSSHGGGPNGYHHQMSKNGTWTTGSEGNTPSGTGAVSNRWDHVVATFDGNYKRVFENGVYLGHQGQHDFGYNDRIMFDQTYWAIGCQSDGSAFNGRYFDGKIAIVRIYDAPMSVAQVLHNYNIEKSRFGL